ncbi:PREDICTED: uncharacterized protein LOC106811400 [Priapulus caudatus]|uniref:Uncharacterized protein LOC106811400 n=1 Tax=Priapulus caudatus TaxID=37621 RepID=A0ABM1EE49_PRICU|nr:PREDICTED: uncharacterized protein LOC106811400 [Priapulus caudatus]
MGAGQLGRFPAATTALSNVSSIGKESNEGSVSGVEPIMESGSETAISSERTISAVETLVGSAVESSEKRPQPSETLTITQSGRVVEQRKLSSSFADPFNLSVDISQLSEEDNEDQYDSDYEPSFAMSAVLPDEVNVATTALAFEEVEFGMEVPEGDAEESDAPEEIGPGIDRIKTASDCFRLTDDVVCLAFLAQIKTLAVTNVTHCTQCASRVSIEEEFVGSALYLKWLRNANPYCTFFHNIQASYMVPTIDDFWTNHQQEILTEMKDKSLIVLGDGRMDSPGFSAQYCTYTFMENESHKILTLRTLDKRTTERKSVNMEKMGFNSALQELLEKELKVDEVVTDAHMAIGACMRTKYPEIKHSNDVWHVAKNLGKKILAAGQQKGCAALQEWSKDIVNHFWFVCQTAQSYDEFVCIWSGVLHHVVNEHEWIMAHGQGLNRCCHGPLDDGRTKPWLDKETDSEAMSALRKIVLDKRFLKRVDYVINFRSTALLEVFHNHVLMYCAKRFAYTPPVYRVRNLLAALDHNVHVERPLMKNKEGNVVYQRCYNKKKCEVVSLPRQEKKTYLTYLSSSDRR